MTWKEISDELARIEGIGKIPCINFRIGYDTKLIVLGDNCRDCTGYEFRYSISRFSRNLRIFEFRTYSNGTKINYQHSIPITAIIDIDELPF